MSIAEQSAVVRRFNRSYTQRIGALEDSFLGMGAPLGTMRLLFEIGAEPGTVQALRARIGLDSGYLSRLLRHLEADGLVALTPDPEDRRRRRVELTVSGRERWAELEARSDERARALVEPLTARQRERLARALAEADLLVRAATVTIETVDPLAAAARAAVGRYVAELDRRFPAGFAPGDPSPADASELSPPGGAFVVAVSDGEPVACGGVRTVAEGVGEIKRMWVHDGWRGAGLGSRLLRHLEGVSHDLGHRVVRLDTNETLTEAIAMYERAGYRRIERYNDNPYATDFFEKTHGA
ncbi:bifunctional helix-turn-helix transcriptional regulator/GNAT family N-acetyltransferase [Antribacter sp. KLBMP9083]|uniref:Bifunctional helix-turn-helix transcriptional regulator/GNAT family N-acetyltransferase n=1 Tax=Antribacter soli TaxID=2910976 RepID=A0AA41UA70_9MICO|nr:helix-turn-helix domain-containing GNAT family N-acetyltransferase [Antribacter soli]MCF4119849.1 bifunctional helix-turn-helix transcriptional regulator/GNAT family N-acetyltransferase [Antribacter soli]